MAGAPTPGRRDEDGLEEEEEERKEDEEERRGRGLGGVLEDRGRRMSREGSDARRLLVRQYRDESPRAVSHGSTISTPRSTRLATTVPDTA
eukprot:1031119-Rhodomonas_salina.1